MSHFRVGALALVLIGAALGGCSRSDQATLASPSSRVGSTSTSTAPVTTVTTPETSVVAVPDPCASSSLSLEAGEGRAALGRGLYVFELRNTSAAACRLLGHPAVAVLDVQGRLLAEAQPAAGRILPDRGPTPVVIGPGVSAYFGLESANVCNEGARPSPSNSLRVTPPGQPGALIVEATITVCPGQAVLVSPVRSSEAGLTQ